MNNDKLWLLLDSVLKRLKHAKYWSTSVDSYDKNIKESIKQLEDALKKIEDGDRDDKDKGTV